MSLPLTFRAAAKSEFDEAASWYESQRSELGVSFIAEIDRVLEAIANQPTLFRIAKVDVRVALVSRFPYAVYYRVKPTRIVVIAVFHTSRDPKVWKSRM